eukprot:1142272-Rhodomonas_salina.1
MQASRQHQADLIVTCPLQWTITAASPRLNVLALSRRRQGPRDAAPLCALRARAGAVRHAPPASRHACRVTAACRELQSHEDT